MKSEAPEHIWRFTTKESIDKLAARFGLPNSPTMQDWEHEVADYRRIDEFLTAYESNELSDDERFTLMEILIQSFNDIGTRVGNLAMDVRWFRTLGFLQDKVELHAYTIWYWSRKNGKSEDERFFVSPFIEKILLANSSFFKNSESSN